jgi:curved DNA-binding protein CbpA
MQLLLTVAAGDAETETAAVARLGRPIEDIRTAATFFIEQILLAPGTDSYRVLGAGPAASAGELRHNMALLMRWLHPDVAREGEQAALAARIAGAWNLLKTPERRAAYEEERWQTAAMPAAWAQAEGGGPGHPAQPGQPVHRGHLGRRHRSAAASTGRSRRKGRLPRLLAFWLLGRPR